ncbi:MAG: hypothetical protein DRI61_11035 [Chloroflexi bacterium]|nr:MAG: hypothetical protein DRI61_11035 [Chloroflexota bacterium]
MKDAADYLAYVRSLIIVNPKIARWTIVREEAQGDKGLFRYRLTLTDGSLLEAFELFRIVQGKVRVIKYSFHWQSEDGSLLKRWDNAAHHPEISTHPSHLHNGEDKVLPHAPVDFEEVLNLITSLIQAEPSE